MTDDVDRITAAIQVHRDAIAILEADLRARERARATARDDDTYMAPSEATAICGRSESQVRRDCEINLLDAGGFAMRKGGRWLIHRETYIEMRGNARFRR